MDDLLLEFLTETNESLDVVDVELIKFEQEPNNESILGNIFRLVHTIKGTCGFLGLPRLEAIAHAAETLMGKFRDGVPVTPEAVTLILASIDRIKEIMADLEAKQGEEPEGEDSDLILQLVAMSEGSSGQAVEDGIELATADGEPALVVQDLERELRPGEVSLDDLEKAFRETEVEIDPSESTKSEPEPASSPNAVRKPPSTESQAKEKTDKGSSVSSQSIRVNVETLENLMTMVSELVLTRNQLLEIVRHHEESEFKVPLQRLSNVTAELQEGVMKTRMQPIGNAWQKLPRIVRDLAQELGKKIELEMYGAETELDRQVLDLIKDPLTHMVRNSADHGLEATADRVAAGKPAMGIIKLAAYHEGGHIIIEIVDDGKGLDVEKIKAKALESGLHSDAELDKMSDAQIHKLIFAAGFSTASKVTNVSGRGVGMDVVRNNIELIGGTVDVKSAVAVGSTFSIKIPLTLAIVSALIVECAGDRFAIPQLSVVELVRVQSASEHKIERIKETPVLRLRNKLLPLMHLSSLLEISENVSLDDALERDYGFIVVMQVGNQNFGVVVDAVFHTEEIVVKPMSSMLRQLTIFSGNTILGDGSVIMIIDPNGVAQSVSSVVESEVENIKELAGVESIDGGAEVVSMLLFRAGSSEMKAVPISLVTRLEEFKRNRIERSDGRDLVQYRDTLMPLVYIDEAEQNDRDGPCPMLVFSDASRSMGLVVDEIVDIVESRFDIELVSNKKGILGTAVIKDRATEIIDLAHFLPQAFEDWFMRKNMDDSPQSRRILFVEDSSFFRNLLTPVIRASGFDVILAQDPIEALELMEQHPIFEMIISDIEMPNMNGFQFAEKLRQEPRWKTTPLIALSSLCTPAAVELARQSGFDDFIAKFDRLGLIAALKEFSSDSEMGEAA